MKPLTISRDKIYLFSIIVLVLLLAGSMWKGCNETKRADSLASQVGDYEMKLKKFETTIDEKGRIISEQKQTILTQQDALDMKILELEGFKKVQSKTVVATRTGVKERTIKFSDIAPDTPSLAKVDLSEWMRFPRRIDFSDSFFGIHGYVDTSGLSLDSVYFNDNLSITIGYKKKKGLKNLFKKPEPVVNVRHDSPYTKTIGLNNVVIKDPPKKFYETRLFAVACGVLIGAIVVSR